MMWQWRSLGPAPPWILSPPSSSRRGRCCSLGLYQFLIGLHLEAARSTWVYPKGSAWVNKAECFKGWEPNGKQKGTEVLSSGQPLPRASPRGHPGNRTPWSKYPHRKEMCDGETCPHSSLHPGYSSGQERVSPLCHPEANVSSVNGYLKIEHGSRKGDPVCLECTGKAHFSFEAVICFGWLCTWTGELSMTPFSDFPFTFNAGWSAGKSPHFTVAEVSPAPRCHPFVLTDSAVAFCSLLPAGLVKNSGSPWCPWVVSSSPSAGAGGAGVCVSAGSTVSVDETTIWISNKHGLTKGILAHLA